jgi:acyl carrier protein
MGNMANLDIASAVRTYLATEPVYAGMIPPNLTSDFSLIDSGALDSIGIFNLVSFLEKSFSIKIEPQDLNETNFRNIKTIEQFVQSRIA